jgi:hypothetical protein
MKKIVLSIVTLMSLLCIGNYAEAGCWTVVNQFGVAHVHCTGNDASPQHCWINANGVQHCCWWQGGEKICN